MGILVMGMSPLDLAQHLYLEGIPTFRQPTFDFTSDVIKNAARNSLEKEINTKFIKSYFPVIYRVFNFCWNLTPSKEVGAALYMLFGVVQNNKHYGTINQETRQYVVNCFGKITIVLQQKFPDLQPPKQEKSCFIATATMGNIDHPYVETLRQYRDLVLRKSRFGQTFIYLYYRNSPPVAKIIAKHTLLRKFSFRFLVNPLYKLASRTLKTRN